MSSSSAAVEDAALPSNFQANWLSRDVPEARSIIVTEGEDGDTSGRHILVIARNANPRAVVWIVDQDLDSIADSHTVIAEESSLTHGLAVYEDYIYASSDTTVFRWPLIMEGVELEPQNCRFLKQKRRSKVILPVNDTLKEIVVSNMNANGQGGAPMGHTTRTLIFDSEGRLYISVGSAGNVDDDSTRSRIRRFDLQNNEIPEGGFDFMTGEVFADGLRNEVGLAFDFSHNVLWGVENGADTLRRGDLGGDIHNDNPAEELNRFPVGGGVHYGYPYCFTEYKLPEDVSPSGRGTIWAWPSFMNDGIHTDEWCRSNTEPPTMAMQAHSAPLGITFYDATKAVDDSCVTHGIKAFPESMHGDAFVAFHGSWNRRIPTGYKVVRIPMNVTGDGLPLADQPLDFFCHKGDSAKWPSGIRPVDVAFDQCNRLLVTSDGTRGRGDGVIIIEYNGTDDDAFTDFSVECFDDSMDKTVEQRSVASSSNRLGADLNIFWTIGLIFVARYIFGFNSLRN